MEPFVVSALKYRPETFADVVGQEAITTTLENAIQNNHLAQALLFCGPRGVGKTTCARILAKKINQDGTEVPDEDFAFNIFELDAASNNSVDDIRTVIDQVRIPPQVGKFKVYIIDEVHMLSQAAFNAFLKTLEEPPAHVIFILATTEKHKIIPTILSRCQIFDFKRIGIEDAKNYLKKIAHQQNIQVDDDALHLIAQKADGAMRDALSIFDRIVSFSGTEVNVEAVSTNLNILDYDTYFEMTTHLIQQQIPEAILLFDKILQKGIDGHHFVTGLATHFRDLWVAKNPETLVLLEVGENAQKAYASQSKTTDSSFLTKAIEIANQCDLQYKISKNQRLLVELTLMQLASINDAAEKKKPSPYIISASEVKLPQKAKEQKLVDAEVIESETESPAIENIVEERKPTYTPPKQMSEGVSGLSLSSLKLKKIVAQQQKQAEGASENLPENEINVDALLKTWQDFTIKLKNEGAHNLATLMQLDTPRLENETEIHLTFPNQTNKVEFYRASEPLLKYLKNSLQNHKISIEIEINEVIEKQYIYTPMEKYEKLKSINPHIETLRKEFKLDL